MNLHPNNVLPQLNALSSRSLCRRAVLCKVTIEHYSPLGFAHRLPASNTGQFAKEIGCHVWITNVCACILAFAAAVDDDPEVLFRIRVPYPEPQEERDEQPRCHVQQALPVRRLSTTSQATTPVRSLTSLWRGPRNPKPLRSTTPTAPTFGLGARAACSWTK